MTPESVRADRDLALARTSYAKYKSSADVWAARPRPLDAAPSSFLWRLPLVVESLSWHYICSEELRSECEASGWGPRHWRQRLLDGEMPTFRVRSAQSLTHRGKRRWGLVLAQAFRQLRVLQVNAPLISGVCELANLGGWFAVNGGQPLTKRSLNGCILVADASLLRKSLGGAPRRLLFLERQDSITSLAVLSEQSGLPERHIQRVWPVADGLFVPVCSHARPHLPRPLLEVESTLWNTLNPTPKLASAVSPGLAIAEGLRLGGGCACGLTSHFVKASIEAETVTKC